MRCLHASPCYAPAYRLGGPVHSLEGLVGALHAQGVDVRVVATDGNAGETLDVPRGWTTHAEVPVRYLPRWAAPDVTPRMFDVVLREAFASDIVHVTGMFCVPTALSLVAAEIARKPTVLSPRGALEAGSLSVGNVPAKRAWLRALRPLLTRVSMFHATAEKEAVSIRAVFGDVPISIVPNGCWVPTTVTHPATKRPVIAAMGRLHPNKGYDLLLRATALLRDRGLDCEVSIAGPIDDAKYVASLHDLVETLGLESQVEFVGIVAGAAKAAHLSRARAFVLASHDTENFANVVIEALSHETPVIASRFSPWAELEAERCGRWVPNDPASLAAALEPYLRDAESAAADGKRGRALVERKYTWSAIATTMAAVYAKCTGQTV